VDGAGAHTSPASQPALDGTAAGAHARTASPQLGAADVSAPPVEPQLPPLGAAPAIVTLWAVKGVVWQEDDPVIDPTGVVHASSAKKESTGPAQVTTEGVQEHAEHVGVGAVSSPNPSKAGVESKPEPHGGAGPWLVGPT
jgi:hypothetical protein